MPQATLPSWLDPETIRWIAADEERRGLSFADRASGAAQVHRNTAARLRQWASKVETKIERARAARRGR